MAENPTTRAENSAAEREPNSVANEAVSSAEIREATENPPPPKAVARAWSFVKDKCVSLSKPLNEKEQQDIKEGQKDILSLASGMGQTLLGLSFAAVEILYKTIKSGGKMTVGEAYKITAEKMPVNRGKKEKK